MSEEQLRTNYCGPPELFDPHFVPKGRGQYSGGRGGYSNNGNRDVQSNMGRPQQPLALTQTPHTAAAAVCQWEGCGSTAITNDVAEYSVTIDSSNQIIVTSTSKAIAEMFYLPHDFVKPSYPIEYDDNEFVLERVNPVKRMVDDVPLEFK